MAGTCDLAEQLKATEEVVAKAKKAHATEFERETLNEVAFNDTSDNLNAAATARQKLLDAIKINDEELKQPEADYEAEAAHHQATKVPERLEHALRLIRVVARCRALIDKLPSVLWMGIEAIFTRGYEEDRKAPANARWLIDPPPPSEEDDTDYKPPGSTL